MLIDFLNISVTIADQIVGLKSIAAYRSGLEINTHVTIREAEEGLADVLQGKCRILMKIFCLCQNAFIVCSFQLENLSASQIKVLLTAFSLSVWRLL